MTGPEHYRKAEHLLVRAHADEGGSDSERYHVAAAQVHATLALAAATAQVTIDRHLAAEDADEVNAWLHVLAEDADAYDGMTNADVIGADELYEMDQDAEFAHDAAADAEAGESR